MRTLNAPERKGRARGMLAGLLAATLWAMSAGAGEGDDTMEPLLPEPLPDPYVFHDGAHWYVFGTGTHFFHGPALARDAMQRDHFELDFGEEGGPYGIWGFKPYRHADGSWHAYVTIHYGRFVTSVAHFVPEEGERWLPGDPVRRWRFASVLAGGRSPDEPVAYDQSMVTDDDGAIYLVYDMSPRLGADVSIMVQRMRDPATPDPTFPPRPLLAPAGYRSEDRNPGYIQIVEGTNIQKVDGRWVLVYSVGDFALYDDHPSNYKIGVAYSDTLIPPEGQTYQRVLIPDPNRIWGNADREEEVCYLLQSQQPEWPNYCAQWVKGPGLGNIVRADGADWVVFHGYKPDATGQDSGRGRYVWKRPLEINIDPARPMHAWLRVRFPGDGDG